jgi:hypothetical protein
MNCDGLLNFGDINPFWLALSNPSQYEAQFPDCNILNGDINGDKQTNMSDLTPFTMLLSGGLGSTGLRAEYTWDAENRLIAVRPVAPTAGSSRVEFGYDYLGRRVQKKVYNWVGPGPDEWATMPAVHRKFVGSGWLLLMELDGDSDILRKYTWGLDLAGLSGAAAFMSRGDPYRDRQGAAMLEGAGGISGLLAMSDTNGTPANPGDDLNYVYFYDATLDTAARRQGQAGNVGQLIDLFAANAPAAIKAHYEYDPYANTFVFAFRGSESVVRVGALSGPGDRPMDAGAGRGPPLPGRV